MIRPSALGDVSRTVPVLATLRQAYPQAEINWLVATNCYEAIRAHPMLTKAVKFERQWGRIDPFSRTVSEGVGFVKRLRQPPYDVVYDLQGLARSGFFTRLTGARRRVGFADARELAWLGYNVRHEVPADRRHTVDRMLALLEADGLTPVRDMRLYLAEDDALWWRQEREKLGIVHGDYAVIAPTARWLCKCWPGERYAEIVRRLLKTGIAGGRIVLLAAPNERKQVDIILKALGDLAERVVWPQTTVGQMMAILSETRLLVCNDSAPLHIAVGFDRPVVALFGPTDPEFVGPYGRLDAVVRPPEAHGHRLKYRDLNDQSLIAKVDADTVWRKIETTLDVLPDTAGTIARSN